MTDIDSFDVANAFLQLAAKEGLFVSNRQLQSLVIISQGVALGFGNEPIIRDPIRAWDFGPVIYDLYESLRPYGKGLVRSIPSQNKSVLHSHPLASQAIRATWEAYKGYSTQQLTTILSGPESLWHKAWHVNGRQYGEISIWDLRDYYAERIRPVAH